MHAQSEPSAPCFSKTRGVLSVYWSSFAIIISLISLFIRWKDSIIYMLPTHSHIGYSNTSHAWLASLLTRISFLTECVLSVQLFFFFFYHWWWCRCLSALSKKKLYLSSDRATPNPKKSLLRADPALPIAVRGCLIKPHRLSRGRELWQQFVVH